jgi:hypothetical protein
MNIADKIKYLLLLFGNKVQNRVTCNTTYQYKNQQKTEHIKVNLYVKVDLKLN